MIYAVENCGILPGSNTMFELLNMYPEFHDTASLSSFPYIIFLTK